MEASSEPAERPSAEGTGPQSDIRTTAGQDSNLAAVLAGFAFTAVILVMQQTPGPSGLSSSALTGQATASFLVAFFGCLVSATLYAVVASSHRTYPDTLPRNDSVRDSVSTKAGGR